MNVTVEHQQGQSCKANKSENSQSMNKEINLEDLKSDPESNNLEINGFPEPDTMESSGKLDKENSAVSENPSLEKSCLQVSSPLKSDPSHCTETEFNNLPEGFSKVPKNDGMMKLNISATDDETAKKNVHTVNKSVSEALRSLRAYRSSDSESSDIENEGCNKSIIAKATEKLNKIAITDSSESNDSESDSSTETLSSDSEIDDDGSDEEANELEHDVVTKVPIKTVPSQGAVKKMNQAGIDIPDDFPPIPDLSKLNINANTQFLQIGKVTAIIGDLVTVQTNPGIPAFDVDSLLFINDGTNKKPMGPIFDVIGPVSEPIYCIRFNSENDVKNAGVKPGIPVYAAPNSSEYTKFVFVKQLLEMKGSDASWLNDEEIPAELAEHSDDEQEREAKRAKGFNKRKIVNNESVLDKHKRYEKSMNRCNVLNTQVCRLMDERKRLTKNISRMNPAGTYTAVGDPRLQTMLSVGLSEFNPSIPPPSLPNSNRYSFSANPAAIASNPAYQITELDPAIFNNFSPNDPLRIRSSNSNNELQLPQIRPEFVAGNRIEQLNRISSHPSLINNTEQKNPNSEFSSSKID